MLLVGMLCIIRNIHNIKTNNISMNVHKCSVIIWFLIPIYKDTMQHLVNKICATGMIITKRNLYQILEII